MSNEKIAKDFLDQDGNPIGGGEIVLGMDSSTFIGGEGGGSGSILSFRLKSEDSNEIIYIQALRQIISGSVTGNESSITLVDPNSIMTSVVFADSSFSFQGSAETIRGIDWVASGSGASGNTATASWTWNGVAVVVTFTLL